MAATAAVVRMGSNCESSSAICNVYMVEILDNVFLMILTHRSECKFQVLVFSIISSEICNPHMAETLDHL